MLWRRAAASRPSLSRLPRQTVGSMLKHRQLACRLSAQPHSRPTCSLLPAHRGRRQGQVRGRVQEAPAGDLLDDRAGAAGAAAPVPLEPAVQVQRGEAGPGQPAGTARPVPSRVHGTGKLRSGPMRSGPTRRHRWTQLELLRLASARRVRVRRSTAGHSWPRAGCRGVRSGGPDCAARQPCCRLSTA